jgi:hypothetical protein
MQSRHGVKWEMFPKSRAGLSYCLVPNPLVLEMLPNWGFTKLQGTYRVMLHATGLYAKRSWEISLCYVVLRTVASWARPSTSTDTWVPKFQPLLIWMGEWHLVSTGIGPSLFTWGEGPEWLASTTAPWRMDGKWLRKQLGSSPTANHDSNSVAFLITN